MGEREPIEAGSVFEIPYPFVLEMVSLPSEDGGYETMSWRPGVRHESKAVYSWGEYDEQTVTLADGKGAQIITVVSTHKPGKFPLRVFYTRQWISPAGRRFGKTACRVASIAAFRTLISGYRHRVEYVAANASQGAS